ncbi:unnamed protein product [Calicophoron daubneyi]
MERRTEHKNMVLLEGAFVSPFDHHIPRIMTAENRIARFQVILPKEWTTKYRPICLHFAGTGDHTYSRRRYFLANRLLNDGIGSIIIMNPFYWKRKPEDQKGSSLNYVSDLFVMGGALITESYSLLRWCEENGYGPLALHGISMGGYMASLCATVWPKPISLIPCLSWSTASLVFVDGILSQAVDWPTLTKQYFSDSVYSDVIRSLIQPSVPARYRCRRSEKQNRGEPIAGRPLSATSPRPTGEILGSGAPLPNATFPTQTDSERPDLTLSCSPSQMSRTTDFAPEHTLESPTGDKVGSSGSSHASAPQHNGSKSIFLDLHATELIRKFPILSSLKRIHLGTMIPSWGFPEYLKHPLDASLWNSGISLVRSLPDSWLSSSTVPDPEVREFMRELLDYFTHLGNFSPLIDPHLVLAVTAEHDAYIPRDGVVSLTEVFPGSEVRVLPQSGHIGAYVRNAVWTKDFHQAITDCLNRQIESHLGEPGCLGTAKSKKENADESTKKD